MTRISVIQQDIDDSEGNLDAALLCPIDRAATRVVKTGVNVATGKESIAFYQDFECLARMPLPESARRFVEAFDNSSPKAKPFKFELEIPAILL